jgi:hypothetical protein
VIGRRVLLRSPCHPTEVRHRLRGCTRATISLARIFKGDFSAMTTRADFVGSVDENHFDIRRDIRYRNSFLPFIAGDIVQDGDGTRINLVFGLHMLVALFMLLWLGFAGCIAIALIASPSGDAPWACLVPCAMFLFGIVLSTTCYFPEERIAKRKLCELLDAEISPFSASNASIVSR